MIEPSEQLVHTLKAAGYSLTKARQAVFSTLQAKEPQTMAAILASCEASADRASVYRTLALFEKLGIIQRLHIGWKYKLELTDRFTHHHHHLSCVSCGKVFTLQADHTLEARLQALAVANNFVAQDHQIEIRGLCSDCTL